MANYLREFATESAYTEATLNYPSVSLIDENGTVHFDQTALKWVAKYSDSSVASAECDSTSAITQNEITLTNLVSVEIGDCVTEIGDNAFTNCTSLTSCTIGSGVTTIGYSAFTNCTSLTSITINAVTPPELMYAGKITPFYNTNDCPIYVPAASVNTYKESDGCWDRYESRIQARP